MSDLKNEIIDELKKRWDSLCKNLCKFVSISLQETERCLRLDEHT